MPTRFGLRSMTEKVRPSILFYVLPHQKAYRRIWDALDASKYSLVVGEVDLDFHRKHNARIGGSPTADLLAVDLGEASIENAKFILETEPRLKNRIVVVYDREIPPPSEGLIFSRRDEAARMIMDLCSRHQGS